MRVLIFGGISNGEMLRTLYRGLEANGHTVRHQPFMGANEDPAALAAVGEEFQPELSIGFCAERISLGRSLKVIRRLPGVSCYWDFDMPQEAYRQDLGWLRRIIQAFDFAVTVDDSAQTLALFESCSVPVYWMPPLADPSVVASYRDELETPICIVGTGYAGREFHRQRHNRADVACALREAFGWENLTLHGNGWPEGWSAGPIGWDQQFDIYRSAAINVGTFVSIPEGRSKLLNFRPVLCLQAGGFLLQEWHDGIDDCFVDGEDLVYWETICDLVEKIEVYLPDSTARQRIGERGRMRVLSQFSGVEWARQLVSWAEVES
jgi:hypothetical protein